MQMPDEKMAGVLAQSESRPVDELALRKYRGLVEAYRFAGGVYLQEPDSAASAVDSIVRLVTANASYFPLG
jgi:hypothetical protein